MFTQNSKNTIKSKLSDYQTLNYSKKNNKKRCYSLKSDFSTQLNPISISNVNISSEKNKKKEILNKKTECLLEINNIMKKLKNKKEKKIQIEINIVLKKKQLILKLIKDFTSNFSEKLELEKSLFELEFFKNEMMNKKVFFKNNFYLKKKMTKYEKELLQHQEMINKLKNSLETNKSQQNFFTQFFFSIPEVLEKERLNYDLEINTLKYEIFDKSLLELKLVKKLTNQKKK